MTETLAVWLCFSAVAPTPHSDARVKFDCTADAYVHCSEHITLPFNREAMVACMVRNRAKLSPICRRHIREK